MAADPPDVEEHYGDVTINTTELELDDDEHVITQVMGDEGSRQFEYSPEKTGKRFAFRYDSPTAAIREYIANAETACIRRARKELTDAGYTVPDEPEEVIRTARELGLYDAQIEIEHAAHESAKPALEIWDNGDGFSLERYVVLRKIGYSTGADDPAESGTFGQGVLSGFALVSEYGSFSFSTRSYEDGISFGQRVRIDGFDDISGDRDTIGTTFTFDAFGPDARDIDVQDAVAKYSELVCVPVLYREFDETGAEVENEEYEPKTLFDLVDDDALTVTYEDEAVEAIASPCIDRDRSRNDTPERTYLARMPIERNNRNVRSYKRKIPWYYHVRIKREDGAVWACACDGADHEGLLSVHDQGYQQMDQEARDRYAPESELADDVFCPEPIDDRDRLHSSHDQFFALLEHRLDDVFTARVEDVLELLDEADKPFQRFEELDPNKQRVFRAWYDHRGSSKSDPSVSNVRDEIEDDLDVEPSDEVCTIVKALNSSVSLAERHCRRPNRAGGRTDAELAEVVARAGEDGDVYMGVTVNKKKTKLAWALHEDNRVVRVDSTDKYDLYGEYFGWKKLKDLPSRNVEEKLDVDLDEGLLEQVDKAYGDTESSSGTSRTLNPKTRRVEVKCRASSKRFRGKQVYDAMDGGDELDLGFRQVERVLSVRQTSDPDENLYGQFHRRGTAITYVPNYVDDYITDAEKVFDTVVELQADMAETEVMRYPLVDGAVDVSRPTSVSLGDVSEDTLVLGIRQRLRSLLTNPGTALIEDSASFRADVMSDIPVELEDYDAVVLAEWETLQHNWLALPTDLTVPDEWDEELDETLQAGDGSADVVHRSGENVSGTKGCIYMDCRHWNQSLLSLVLQYALPPEDYPRDSEMWDRMVEDNVNESLLSADEGHPQYQVVQTLRKLDGGF